MSPRSTPDRPARPVAIIFARGGSKRIPGKNIRLFHGRPIIAYSIAAARDAGIFERVMVSTDCPKIADVARGCGAEVPFVRPASLADDHTGVADVVAHALGQLAGPGRRPAHACAIYPTAPFIRAEDLARGLEIVRRSGCTVAASVTTFPYPAQRALTISAAGELAWMWPPFAASRSNDLPPSWHDAAQFFWVHVERFLERPRIFDNHTLPVPIPRHLVQDIDTDEDWVTAECMHAALQGRRLASGAA